MVYIDSGACPVRRQGAQALACAPPQFRLPLRGTQYSLLARYMHSIPIRSEYWLDFARYLPSGCPSHISGLQSTPKIGDNIWASVFGFRISTLGTVARFKF